MQVELAGGVHVDLATKEELHDEVAHALRSEVDRLRPRYLNLGQALAFPASGVLFLDLGGPPAGYAWSVRRCIVSGADPSQAENGKVLFMVGQPRTNPFTIADAIGDLEDYAAQLPASNSWGIEEMMVQHPDHFYVIVTGGTAGHLLVAGMQATEALYEIRTGTAIASRHR